MHSSTCAVFSTQKCADSLFSLQVLKDYQGTISLKELSEMTAIKVEDVVSTLQHLNLIQYQKGQHVICAAPKLIERFVSHAAICVAAVLSPSTCLLKIRLSMW